MKKEMKEVAKFAAGVAGMKAAGTFIGIVVGTVIGEAMAAVIKEKKGGETKK